MLAEWRGTAACLVVKRFNGCQRRQLPPGAFAGHFGLIVGLLVGFAVAQEPVPFGEYLPFIAAAAATVCSDGNGEIY
jgi:hypothetical protein